MKKINYSEEIKESLELLQSSYTNLVTPKLLERCEVLIWLKSGQVLTMKAAMELKGRSSTHGQNLWNQYKKEGLEGLLNLKYKGPTSPLAGKEALKKILSEQGFGSINEARLWILQTYEIEYTENGLGNYFRANKIKLKTGRPSHPKKDETKRATFKKNMRRA